MIQRMNMASTLVPSTRGETGNLGMQTVRCAVLCLEEIIEWLFTNDSGAVDSTTSGSHPSAEQFPSPPPAAVADSTSVVHGSDKPRGGIMLPPTPRPKLIPRRYPNCPRYLHPKLAEKTRSRVRKREADPLQSTLARAAVHVATNICSAAGVVRKSGLSKAVLRENIPREELERARDVFVTVHAHLTAGQDKRRRGDGIKVAKGGTGGAAVQSEPLLSDSSMAEVPEELEDGGVSDLERLLEKMCGLALV